MKHLIKILFVLILLSFVLAPLGILNAADTTVKDTVMKKEKTEKDCCPGCKNTMDKDAAKFTVEHKGKTYCFCSEECKTAFEKDPEKYAACCEEGKVSYVCPMKQCNVKTDKPGKCPKCGMELKKVVEDKECCKHMQEHKHQHKHQHKHEAGHQH